MLSDKKIKTRYDTIRLFRWVDSLLPFNISSSGTGIPQAIGVYTCSKQVENAFSFIKKILRNLILISYFFSSKRQDVFFKLRVLEIKINQHKTSVDIEPL